MRISFMLLVAAASLVASLDAASNFDKVSALASTETNQLEHGVTRFLRSVETKEEIDDDDDDDNLDAESEERANLGNLGKSISLPASLKNVNLPSSVLKSADEVLASMKSPEINQSWLTLMKQVEANPTAKKFAGPFTKQKWTTEELIKAMGISRNTPKDSEKMKAFSLLLNVRTWKNRPNIKAPELDDATVKFLQKVDDNPVAKKYAGEFLEKNWSVETLMKTLGVNRRSPKNTNEMQAVALLLQLRARTNVQTKTGGAKAILRWVSMPKRA